MSPLFRCHRVAAILLLLLPGRSSPAQISATPRVLDFGERGHLEKPSLVVVIENNGAKPVRIREIKPSCSCIEVKPAPPAEIAAFGGLTFTVTMSSGRPMGDLDKYILFSTEDKKEFRIPTKMRVHGDFAMEPWDLRFDAVFGTPQTRHVEVKRKSPGAEFLLEVEKVKDDRMSRPSDHVSARVSTVDGRKRIEVTVLPTHPEGDVRVTVEARLDGKRLVVPVVGEVFRWIKIAPREFNFSRVTFAEPATLEKEILLASTDGKPFRVTELKPAYHRPLPAGVSMEFREEGAGGSSTDHRLRAHITVAPGASPAGSISGKLIIRTDHPDKPEVTSSFFGFFDERRK